MQFNDTTSLSGLIQSCEDWTGLGLAQISGDATQLKRFTRLINANYHKVVTAILESTSGWEFDDANHDNVSFVKTYNLTSGTQYVKMPLSDKILKIRRAEVTYDGTNWYLAMPMDVSEYGGTHSTADLAANFTKTSPFYDVVGNYVYLYPVPDANVTGGLKLWTTREVDEFTTADTTQEPGIDEPFHEMIAVGASLDYAVQHNLSNAANISQKYADYEDRLRRYYGSKEEDRQLILKPSLPSYD